MTRIFENATIRTLQAEGHLAEAAVVDKGRFTFVGDCETARRLHPKAEVVDCKGQTLLPGFNDSHMHLLGYGMLLDQLDLSNASSIQEIQTAVRTFSPERPIVFGRGWNQDYLVESRMPCRADLDEASPDRPVILVRSCGHILCCNSAAMREAGVTSDDGLFREHEMDKIKAILPGMTAQALRRYVSEAEASLLSFGVTSVQSDDLSAVTADDYDLVLETLSHMTHQIRVTEQTNFGTLEEFMSRIPGYRQTQEGNAFFRLGPIKVLGDGSLGAHTAKLRGGYTDKPSEKGLLNFTRDELMRIAEICEDHGLDLAVHAIGDEMVGLALDMVSNPSFRHSIVHCQVTAPDLIKRLADQQPLLHLQPVFLHYDMHIAKDRLGPERLPYAYNYRSLLEAGIPIAFGTDCPVEPPNPFYGIYSAVTRKDRSGAPPGGWMPSEALSLHQCLSCYTIGSAYGSHDEDRLGQIRPGFLADFILLDRDPFSLTPEEWLSLEVTRTYVGGELRYERQD